MASTVPNHFVQQFSSNLKLLLQQEGSRLSQAVTMGSHTGEQASPVDQYAPIAGEIVTQRYGPMPNTEPVASRRWVSPTPYHVNQLIDSFDKLKILVDPQSIYAQNARNALGRNMDDVIIAGLFGSNATGKTGTDTTAFPSTQVVGVNQGAASATNVTVAKLREAKRLLMAADVDVSREEIYCALNATNHDSLLAEAQVISGDFNDRLVLVDGIVNQFLGIKFIITNLLTTATDDQAGTSTQVPVWVKSGAYMGLWEDIQVDISQRKDLTSLPFQVYCKAMFGATRLEEKKVVKIWAR